MSAVLGNAMRTALAAIALFGMCSASGTDGRSGLTRWAELASNGNAQVIEAVLEVEGTPAKVTQLDAIMEVLTEAAHGISADVKDDESVVLSIEDLNRARRLNGFVAPARPAAGPGRCSAVLLAYAEWAAARGYRLVPIDTRDEDWNAVLVKAAHHEQFLTLSAALGIGTLTPQQAYGAGNGKRIGIGRRR